MYCITRIKKVNTRTNITQASEHNLRLRTQPNIDASKSHQNKVLLNSLDVDVSNASSLQEKLTAHYKQLGVKERKDNVLMLEFIATASPEFFKGKTAKQIEDWADHQLEFFKKEFGSQVKMAVVHQDESSPHLHIMLSTEQKSVKNYKNRYGESKKETWSLNAKRYDRQFLVDFQTRFATWNKKYGLRRGVKGSMRKHNPVKEFYKVVDKALSTDYSKVIEAAYDEVPSVLGATSKEKMIEIMKPVFNKALKQIKVVKEKFKVDAAPLMEAIEVKQKELDRLEEDLEGRKEVYKVELNAGAEKNRIIKEQQAEIARLQKEVEKLQPVKPLDNSQKFNTSNKKGLK